MSEDLYAVLGVSPDADPAVIRAAYLALVRMHHPDGETDPEAHARAEQKTKSLNSAYSVLGDAKRRAAYDERRRRPRLNVPPQTSSSGKPGSRNAFKGRPNQRTGPSLQARREQLRKVKLASVALAVVALVLLFVAFTGAVGMLRPSWLSPEPPDFSPTAMASSDAAGVVPEVMLPWPAAPGGQGQTMSAGGLKLSFLAVEAGGEPVLQVADSRGSKVTMTGATLLSSDRNNLFGLGSLEGSGKPAALIVATPMSEGCCLVVRVVYRGRDGLKVANLGEMPTEVAERYPSDVDDDGRPEWLVPDRRFVAAFGPSSAPPPMVFQFANGRLRDISENDGFGEIFSSHLAPAQRLCTLGSSGACASFVASAARLGKAEWAWDIMLRNYHRDAVHEATGGCASETDPQACAEEANENFPARLRRFLRASGYVSSTAVLPDATPG